MNFPDISDGHAFPALVVNPTHDSEQSQHFAAAV